MPKARAMPRRFTLGDSSSGCLLKEGVGDKVRYLEQVLGVGKFGKEWPPMGLY